MRNNPFNFKRTFLSDLGGAWPATGVSLEVMMYLFYQVRNFEIHLSALDLGGSLIDLFASPSEFLARTGLGSQGMSQRRCAIAPNLLNQLDDAYNKTLTSTAVKKDIDDYNALKLRAISSPAPAETRSFLRVIDINTSGVYPIFSFSGPQISLRIDMGSVKKIGELFFPACYAILGTEVQTLYGLDILGYVTGAGLGGLQIPIYSTNKNLGIAYGTITPKEVYSDLQLTPSHGNGGQLVTIAMPSPTNGDLKKQKNFTGFQHVTQVSYDGFDITSSMQKTRVKLTEKDSSGRDVYNETCTLTVPERARSSYFSFICDGPKSKNDYNALIYDQFTVPNKFTMDDYPSSLTTP